MGVKPTVTILADGADVTEAVMARLESLTLTDNAGDESDSLTLELENADEKLEAPAEGRVLTVYLGYDGEVTDMGQFVVDEVDAEGPPSKATVRARATPFDAAGELNTMQTKKRRSFELTTIGELVATIAGDAGLEPVVASSLAGIALPHIDQADESDIHLLTRIAKDYGAFVKPASGRLMFLAKGSGQTASGTPIPRTTITRTQVERYAYNRSKRDATGSVVATYRDPIQGLDQEIKAGEAEPVDRLRFNYSTREEAQAAAEARLKQAKLGKDVVSLTMPGDTAVVAGSPIELSGFPLSIDGRWLIKKVTHSVTPSDGYTMTVESETEDEDAAGAGSGSSNGGGSVDPGGLDAVPPLTPSVP